MKFGFSPGVAKTGQRWDRSHRLVLRMLGWILNFFSWWLPFGFLLKSRGAFRLLHFLGKHFLCGHGQHLA